MATPFTLTSSAFANGDLIPARFTCDGSGYSPALAWSNAPAETKSFVLLVHDPDAPAKDWLHWLVVNIPPSTTSVTENNTPPGGTVLLNDSNETTYDGLCPPNGRHRYYFIIYALDIAELTATTWSTVELAMTGHILARGQLLGLYQRPERLI